MLTSATKQKQWFMAGSVWVTVPGHIINTCNIEKNEACNQFHLLKLLIDFLEVRD